MTDRILCVDDEANILDAYQRSLRKQFHIETALGSELALAQLDPQQPFAAVVADMRMPGMDGIQLLKEIKHRAPTTVRIMLTGNADQRTAIDAVNEGNIFRFLTKPCPPETLAKALTAGIEQHRLLTAEKVLVENTLRGAIKVLTDILSITNPTAFGRAARVQRLVKGLCEALKVERPWEHETAAMLSQIGCVTIPPETLDKVYRGRKLTTAEQQMLAAHPEVGHNLVANIPRLENVARIIAYQQKHYDGTGIPADETHGKDIPLGARILKLALDYDALKAVEDSDLQVLTTLRHRVGWYDASVLTALESVVGFETFFEPREIRLKELTIRMVLAADVRTSDGTILVAKGQEVTHSLCQRLINFARNRSVQEPIHVLVPCEKPAHLREQEPQPATAHPDQ